MNARVVLVDDHTLVRAGLRAVLDGFAGVDVVGEGSDGAAALNILRSAPADIVITDITMPGLDGLGLAESIRRDFPQVRVIVLSMHGGSQYVQQALAAGVSAYLLKDAAMLELEFAIQAVLRGETYLSSGISKLVVEGYVQATTSPPEALTSRQREILKLLATGQSAKEVAHRLGIATKTVEAHRSQIMDRLNIHDVAGLVRYAVRSGLVDAD